MSPRLSWAAGRVRTSRKPASRAVSLSHLSGVGAGALGSGEVTRPQTLQVGPRAQAGLGAFLSHRGDAQGSAARSALETLARPSFKGKARGRSRSSTARPCQPFSQGAGGPQPPRKPRGAWALPQGLRLDGVGWASAPEMALVTAGDTHNAEDSGPLGSCGSPGCAAVSGSWAGGSLCRGAGEGSRLDQRGDLG